jgi:ethanolamine utilization protein EutN
MRLATVLGQVVSTVKRPGLESFTLLLVRDAIDADTSADSDPGAAGAVRADKAVRADEAGGAVYVAVDLVGAGTGEVVLVACGGAARVAAGASTPTDRAVVAIVDTVLRAGAVTYQKA